MRIWVRIESAAGPGLDWAIQRGRAGPVVTGARVAGSWLGADRAAVVETDGDNGTPLRAVVSLPSSASSGAWLEAELRGAFVEGERTVVIATLPGHGPPIEALLRVAARVSPDAKYLSADAAQRLVRRARERYRRRRSEARRIERPAWLPPDDLIAGAGHSTAEERLRRLPPRFVRGLRGLLDDDERILASIEREPDRSGGLFEWRRGRDRRAGLLILTDRQLLSMVDHLPPDRYLSDWGVDVDLLPLEALSAIRLEIGRSARLAVMTRGGEVQFPMPADSEPELRALAARIETFLPTDALRRRYPIDELDLDTATLAPFRQNEEARERIDALRSSVAGGVAAAFYAPRRQGVKESVALLLSGDEVVLDVDGSLRRVALRCLRSISMALSPLIGKIELRSTDTSERFSYPAPLAAQATAFIRQLRRAWANG